MSRAAVLCALLGAAACHKSAGDLAGNGQPPGALSVSKVAWNATDGGVGNVQAVTELAENVYVFSDQGAEVFAAGTPLSSDSTITAWKSATTIPAADGNGSWPVGLDAQGKLWHVRSSGALEPVSGRYGFENESIIDVAALGGAFTAFALPGGLAVSDGQTVTRYDGAAQGVAGGQGRAAWLQGDAVRRFDPAHGVLEKWTLAGAKLLAMNPDGRIAAATQTQLFYESGTLDLNLVYTAAPGATITALAAAGPRFWFVAGGRLGVLERGQVQRTADASTPADAKLYGSPSGDAWLLQGGELHRMASAGNGDFALWQQTVLPIFSRVCASCHLPSGTAGVDLASYEKWKAKRALIQARVIEQKPSPMPPSGSGVTLSADDLNAIKTWASNPG